jgi:hypothetical protein
VAPTNSATSGTSTNGTATQPVIQASTTNVVTIYETNTVSETNFTVSPADLTNLSVSIQTGFDNTGSQVAGVSNQVDTLILMGRASDGTLNQVLNGVTANGQKFDNTGSQVAGVSNQVDTLILMGRASDGTLNQVLNGVTANGQKLDAANETLHRIQGDVEAIRARTDPVYARQLRATAIRKADLDIITTNVPSLLVQQEGVFYCDHQRGTNDATSFTAKISARYGLGGLPSGTYNMSPTNPSPAAINIIARYRYLPIPDLSLKVRRNTGNLERQGARIYDLMKVARRNAEMAYPDPAATVNYTVAR